MAIISIKQDLPIQDLSGLEPQVWLCVGSGFAREELKASLAKLGLGWTSSAITDLQAVLLKVAQVPKERFLSPGMRIEILRRLLGDSQILSQLPELKKLKRKPDFISRIDQALQAGRMTFAHEAEEEVYVDRLLQSGLIDSLREEFGALSKAFEAWLRANALLDLPELLHSAIQKLEQGGDSSSLELPREIWLLSIQDPESLEKLFWERLSDRVRVLHQRTPSLPSQASFCSKIDWLRAHTLDDMAEYLMDDLTRLMQRNESNWDDYAVLIPDVPSVRRSLNLASTRRNIPLADPRDPTRLRWEESIKWGLNPLEVVAKNFEPMSVITYLKFWMDESFNPSEDRKFVQEIYDRAIQKNLKSYSGGMLEPLHQFLSLLFQKLGGRKTVAEFSVVHLEMLQSYPKTPHWVISFFESIWNGLKADLGCVQADQKRAPLFYWLEKLKTRIQIASPPASQLKPSCGLKIYRLQQTPPGFIHKVWIFGMPSHWLRGLGAGDDWFTDRSREILAQEFAVRSSVQVREERLETLSSWIEHSGSLSILDAQFEFQGRERDSLFSLVKECSSVLKRDLPLKPEDFGAHPRTLPSYKRPNEISKSEILFRSVLLPHHISPSLASEKPVLTASELDRYTRCPFQALIYYRWKLEDLRRPGMELRPDMKGVVLHEAVRKIMSDSKNNFLETTPLPLVDFSKNPPVGLYRTPLIQYYNQHKVRKILEAFIEKEAAYRKKTQGTPIILDNLLLTLEYEDFKVIGRPDRIDQHAEGIFIIEYKSSGQSPHGQDMVNLGYRLQLPAYALAAGKQFSQPILGAQFVELNKKASRSSGLFFAQWNGTQIGKISQARSNSKSLFQENSEKVFSELEAQVIRAGKGWVRGEFTPSPVLHRSDQECKNCRVATLCGYSRRASLE